MGSALRAWGLGLRVSGLGKVHLSRLGFWFRGLGFGLRPGARGSENLKPPMQSFIVLDFHGSAGLGIP